MSNNKDTPNFKMLFRTYVSLLQTTYNEYIQLYTENLKLSFINDDGYLCIEKGYIDRAKRIQTLADEVKRLEIEVDKYRRLSNEYEEITYEQ